MRTCEFVTITTYLPFFATYLVLRGGKPWGGCFCFSRPCWGFPSPWRVGTQSWGTFHGELTWSPATWYGSERWRIVMQFSEDLMLPRWAWIVASDFFWLGDFCGGGNHLDRWSKRFNYTYIIYIHMVDFLFSGSDDLDGGLKKPEVFLQKSW